MKKTISSSLEVEDLAVVYRISLGLPERFFLLFYWRGGGSGLQGKKTFLSSLEKISSDLQK